MDSTSYTVALVRILANEDELLLTDHYTELAVGEDIYLSCPSMEFDLPEQVGDFSNSEGTIKNLIDRFPIIDRIVGDYPYNKVEVTVSEMSFDDSFNATDSRVLFSGLLYTSERGLSSGYVDLTLRNWKYYAGITGGNPCTENCSVQYFGDRICQKVVAPDTVQLLDISGDTITLSRAPVGVAFLYNKGYISLNGVNIKILHWEEGATMQTRVTVPQDWLGQQITVHAGCDRSIQTCRNIHDNEANFYGLGISMVDYNPHTERS